MKICVAIDRWKLPIFNKHLQAAGFKHSTEPGLSDDTLHLYVITNAKDYLIQVIREANHEAKHTAPSEN
jgi:hypothetical protein